MSATLKTRSVMTKSWRQTRKEWRSKASSSARTTSASRSQTRNMWVLSIYRIAKMINLKDNNLTD